MDVKPQANILIVDDNPSMTRTMALILEHKGYAVSTAQDGQEAVEKIVERPFNLVLMDIKMPRLDGIEAFRQVKRIRPQTTVIMMTAYTADDRIQQALDEGAYGVLYKPPDIDRLLGLLQEVLERGSGRADERAASWSPGRSLWR